MRILIISNYFDPAMNARAFRWGEITRRWSVAGNEVEVISRWMPGSLTYEVKDGVVIHRVGRGFFEFLRGAREAKFKRSHFDRTEVKSSGVMEGVRKFAKRVHDLTWKKIYWPDFGCLWSLSARKKALELFRAKGFDAIVSVAPPFSSHLVAFLSRKKVGEVPWIVDVGDPFCFMLETPVNNMALYSRLNYKAERSIFRSSDYVTVTTAKTAERYRGSFPEFGEKVKVIPPMVSLWESEFQERRKNAGLKKVVLAYIGSLVGKIREPDRLLEIIRAAVRLQPDLKGTLELHFFGDVSMCGTNFERYGDIREMCVFRGMVARNVVPRAMADADILVNIGNATNYQLPSKIVEYIYSGKPIINICSIPDDSSADALDGHPYALNVFDDGKSASDDAVALLDFVAKTRGKTLPREDVKKMVSAHTVAVISEQYMALIKMAIADRASKTRTAHHG